MPLQDLGELLADDEQALRQGSVRRRANDAPRHPGEAGTRDVDHAVAGAADAGVDAEDAGQLPPLA